MSAGSGEKNTNPDEDGGLEAYRRRMREGFQKQQAEENQKRLEDDQKRLEDDQKRLEDDQKRFEDQQKLDDMSAKDEEIARSLQEEFKKEEDERRERENMTPPPPEIIPVPESGENEFGEEIRMPDQVYSERLIGNSVTSEAADLRRALQESAAEAGVTPTPFVDPEDVDTDGDGDPDRRLAVELQRQEWSQG